MILEPIELVFVINKTDLAPAVGADLAVMERDALRMRDGGPFVFAQVCYAHFYLDLIVWLGPTFPLSSLFLGHRS